MKVLAWLALAIVIEASSCPAQETPSPSATIQDKHPLVLPVSIDFTLAGDNVSRGLPPDFHFAPASAGSVVVTPAAATRRPFRTADTKFVLLNGLYLGMAVFDVEMTQHCIAAQHCREINPLMPSSQAGQLTINFALVAGVSTASYWLKKHSSAVWWLPPVAGTAAHSAGVATGFVHQ